MTKCSYCQSLDVKKNGFNYIKDYKVQKYKCLSCGKIFSYSNRLPKNHVSSEIVSLCIDLYLKGLSYRIIKRQLLEQFGIRVSHTTIYYWLQNYSELVMGYADSLDPKLSVVWQMDETWLDFKGHYKVRKTRKKGNWCWDCIDTRTRYMLGMHLAKNKQLESGMKFFERIMKATSTNPEVISTDGNVTYLTCIRKYFPNATHVKLKQISLKPNTSFIERWHSTLKNRTKTMRCFDSFMPCQNWLNLYQIYYNFLRPHMALGGKTPAQEAGIDLDLPDRWTSLIRNALLVANHFN